MISLRWATTHCKRCLLMHRTELRRKYSDAECILTGLQPTGELHVGNYFGAVQRCVRLQEELPAGARLLVMVADLHALTGAQSAAELRARTLDLAAALLASGLRPSRTALFLQSAVPRHAQLAWVLGCLASRARLQAQPQLRARARQQDVSLGLLGYPVLQAADILLYRAARVPVGADQLQHLQLAAQLVTTFHHRFGCRLFPTPRPIVADDMGMRLRSLRDPTKKMSKSDPDPKSRILLSDSDDAIRLKVRKAVTDLTPSVSYEPDARPGVSNLVALHCLAAGLQRDSALDSARGLTTAQYKALVAEQLVRALGPLRDRARALRDDEAALRDLLRDGAARAGRRADRTWREVAAVTGLAPH